MILAFEQIYPEEGILGRTNTDTSQVGPHDDGLGQPSTDPTNTGKDPLGSRSSSQLGTDGEGPW
jgi:hypothetical protein